MHELPGAGSGFGSVALKQTVVGTHWKLRALLVSAVRRFSGDGNTLSGAYLQYMYRLPTYLSTLYVTSHGGISTATTAW